MYRLEAGWLQAYTKQGKQSRSFQQACKRQVYKDQNC